MPKNSRTKTCEVPVVWASSGSSNSERTFSKKAARQILGIKTRTTFNERLRSAGLYGKARFTFSDLIEVFKVGVYLMAGYGNHSHAEYAWKRSKSPKLLEVELRRFGLNQRLEEFKNANYA